ncbi:MAG: hypothetical protein RLY20_2247 [Verrucomicrobiota bacterium]|jgi:carbamoylphosphate synthase large subunit
MNPKRVLIGSAGTGAGFAAACALRRVWSRSVYIVAMDINPGHLVTASLMADQFEQVPLSKSPEFAESLLRILEAHSIETYLPLFPEEIVLAARLHKTGRMPSAITVLAPPSSASEACADKWVLNQLLPKHNVRVPRSAIASNPWSADEFFLKPRDGTGSRGVRCVKRSELKSAVGERAVEWIVQELCAAPEVTVDAFCDPVSGFIRALCRERIEVKSGVATKCRLFEDDELSNFARGVAGALNLAGSFCFQVMRNASGWAVTDVNPRPGAATVMCAATGNDFIAATFARRWGEDVQRFFRPLAGEQFVTRQYSEFVMGKKS